MSKSKFQSWVERARGNEGGTKFIISFLSKFGLFPSYLLLCGASLQYTITDKQSRKILKDLYSHLKRSFHFYNHFFHIYSFGMALVDRFAFLLSPKQLFDYDGENEQLIIDNVSRGNGCILLGSHIGNWEIAGNLLSGKIDKPIYFIMYDNESKGLKDEIKDVLAKRKVQILNINNQDPSIMIQMINILRQGGILCIHGDRVAPGQKFTEIDFLGEKARFPIGPFILGAVSGSPIIPVICLKSGIRKYHIKAYEPMNIKYTNRSDRDIEIQRSCKKYVEILESTVKKHPYQWYNFFPFWGKE